MNKSSLTQLLSDGLRHLNLDYGLTDKLLDFVFLLEKWNKSYNLTAIRDPEQMVILHIIDSASVYSYLDGKTIIDVGTGGGIPGIVFALLNPRLQVTLLDASQKKTRFLRFVKRQLNLTNVTIVCERVENFNPKTLYDVVISRAFSEVGNFLHLAGHLCSAGGHILAMKGPRVESENEVRELGFEMVQDIDIKVPYLDAKRRLLIFNRL